MLPLTQDLLEQVKAIAIAAGEAILAVYQRDFSVEQKDDDSPLTEADLAAHHLILSELTKLTPAVPVLSEEAADIPWSERQQWTNGQPTLPPNCIQKACCNMRLGASK